MTRAFYLKPSGLLYGSTAARACEGGQAARLAGGPVAFSQIELIEGEPGASQRQTVTYADAAASQEPAVQESLERVRCARADLAGLSLDCPRIMGVVNVTPDSFSDGGLYNETETAISHAAGLAMAGADIVDVGGESTRPGSEGVDCREELGRVVPVLKGLKGIAARISVDTRRGAVMTAAAEAGVHIINDVSALTHDDTALAAARDTGLPVVLMHAQGDPRTMQRNPTYKDVVLEVFDYLADRIAACEATGLVRARLVVDPGIGFGKTIDHNLALLSDLTILHGLGVPVLLGASRKSFIGSLTGESEPLAREAGSVAAALAGAAQGVQILRMHDVVATRQALKVWSAAITGEG